MKIAVSGTRGIPNLLGGVETHCEELFPRLAAYGFDITVFRRKNYVKDQLTEYKGVHLVTLQAPKKKAFEAIVHTIKSVVYAKWKLKAKVIHIHAVGPALAIPFARILGLKVVFTHHGPDYERDKWGAAARFMLRLGERWGVRYANEVIVISQVINRQIQQRYQRMDAHLIYNGVPHPVIQNDIDYLKSLNIQPKKYIFALGRFVPEKKFHQLIQAFTTLKDKRGYQLVIAGDVDIADDYSQSLKQLAHENQVVLTGFVKGVPLQTLWSHAAAFVLPSSHEGLPISLLEAMSYQLPAIVSDIEANLEVGLPKGCYFPVNEFNVLTEKLERFIHFNAAKPFYDLTKYQWDRIAKQTAAVYQRL
ncbi:MAG: glycosyltransferase family 4 protein [Dysgonamonadaceae bacterium]|jgi:glycosyltransferase involved in cell wall biosynthesis|nr:glycosyltransferase family 4 protein [Dysgonamonadaceae bacterium]